MGARALDVAHHIAAFDDYLFFVSFFRPALVCGIRFEARVWNISTVPIFVD
jgi:hypothetical protein